MGQKSGRTRRVSKKTRFEVFKRDKFTCQYCGRTAPDVVLNCDHITPVAAGGTDEILNLITSCFECNNGKRARRLDDSSELTKQVDEMKSIQERREQIAMLKKWRDECRGADSEAIGVIEAEFKRAYGMQLTDSGKATFRRMIKKHGLREILLCTVISIEHYEDGETAFNKVAGIVSSRELDRQKPGLGRLPYIAAILRNRRIYADASQLRSLVESVIDLGDDVESLVDLAKAVKNWTDFHAVASHYIEQATEAANRKLQDDLFGLDSGFLSSDPICEVW